jgi:hypothetical protein
MSQRNSSRPVAGLCVGDRIRLVHMVDDPDPVLAGTIGTVTEIHFHSDWTQIEVSWESGRMLMLSSPPDKFEIIDGDR